MATYDLTQNLVTLINLIPDGDMESSSWTNGNYSTTEKKYGSRSQYFTSSTTRIMTKAMTTLPIVNHKYYGRHYLKTNGSVNADDCRFEWYAGDGDGLNYVFGWNRGNYTDWTMESNIITVSAVNGSSYQCRSFMVNPTGELWADGLMIVDLTAAFGSGNEPTKDWCDKNIPFFVGTTYVPTNLPETFQAGDILNVPYTGHCISIMLPKKNVKMECWGAQGGTYSSYYGGAGGYSVGSLVLPQEIELHIQVGGQPATNSTSQSMSAGGYNGGGQGAVRYYSSTYSYGQGGGGGSDIRLGQDSLYARVIVAGGGGGSSSVNAKTTKYGGGESGGSPTSGYGATQTSGGTSGTVGTFGVGASTLSSKLNYKYGSGGGGGGWYGGAAASVADDSTTAYRGYNGGGSGYVYTSLTATNYPSGCLLNSTYYLKDASIIAGNNSFVDPDGTTVTGHEGNGYVRITIIKKDNQPINIKVGGVWKQTFNGLCKVSGAWKKIIKYYQKVNGVWKLLLEILRTLSYYGTTSNLTQTGNSISAVTVGNYALFAGGYNGSYSSAVNAYDKSLTKTRPTSLSNSISTESTAIGQYALFGGGYNGSYVSTVDVYDTSLTKSTTTDLSAARRVEAGSVGNYALFGGGYNGSTYSSVVDVYNTSLTKSTTTDLSAARRYLSTTTVGNYVLFGGGKASSYLKTVDVYNISLTKSTATDLTNGGAYTAASTINNYALFGGGQYTSSSNSNVVDVYNASLTKSTATNLSAAKFGLAATTVDNYVLFGGGSGSSALSTVDVYDASLTKSTITDLSVARYYFNATTVGKYALFGGGREATLTYSSVVDVYVADINL